MNEEKFNFINKPDCEKIYLVATNAYNDNDFIESWILTKMLSLSSLLILYGRFLSEIPKNWETYQIDVLDEDRNELAHWTSFNWNPDKPNDNKWVNDMIKDLKKQQDKDDYNNRDDFWNKT